MKSWQAGGFNLKVIKRVMELVHSRKAAAGKLRIYITGELLTHSLRETSVLLSRHDGAACPPLSQLLLLLACVCLLM